MMSLAARWILPQLLGGLLVGALSGGPAWAVPPVNTEAVPGVAIKGYDPVAYHTGGAPAEGMESRTVQWEGATWWFASAENQALFSAAPERYAPAFGGWCAYAVAKNRTADIDPASWTIVDGTLYLNYSPSIKVKWEADIPGHIKAAEENWPKLKDASPVE